MVTPESIPALAAAGRLRVWIREKQTGGCRSCSGGSACTCPLCDVDRLAEAVLRTAGSVSLIQARAGRWYASTTIAKTRGAEMAATENNVVLAGLLCILGSCSGRELTDELEKFVHFVAEESPV